eukprot:TRINITY_DN46284_c0_g2_i5.p1 TRINITY_DN46284_c0_g2~~TRINITY_DN46284_c0_g2_i5.p1  ORF type:complete len:273 (-),score=22.00 TRINITY_DN46284_c0_g2_i5:101-919(-)
MTMNETSSQNTSVEDVLQLQSVNIKPRWEELVTLRQHIHDLILIFNNSKETVINIKLPENSAQKFVQQIDQNLDYKYETCFFTSNQVQMMVLFSRTDLNIINQKIVVKQILFKLVKFAFKMKRQLSMQILREGVFKILELLRPELKAIFEEEVLPEILRQLKILEKKGTINNVETTARNLFALMVLDDFVTADTLILSAMEQVYKKNITIGKMMIELLCTTYPKIFCEKIQKPLNLKVLQVIQVETFLQCCSQISIACVYQIMDVRKNLGTS